MKKSVISLLIAMLLVINTTLTSCGEKVFWEGKPTYTDTGELFQIGAWVAPPPEYVTVERYEEIKQSGIRTMYSIFETNIANIVKEVQCATEVGIGVYVQDSQIMTLLDEDIENLSPTYSTRFNAYKNMEGFKGHSITDEPGFDEFEQLGKLKSKYEAVFPNDDYYINLFPAYAKLSDLGTKNYYEYLDSFMKIVGTDFLSYDAYPLLKDQFGLSTSIEESYLYNLEIAQIIASKYNVPLWKFQQSIGYGLINRIPESQADINFQIYVDMAYGTRGFQYFTYWTPPGADRGNDFTPAMIDLNGEKTDIYNYVQTINNIITKQEFEQTMLNFNWEGTQLSLGKNSKKNVSFNMMNETLSKLVGKSYPYKNQGIKSITSNEDAIVGCFNDKNGNKGYMLVNYTDPFKLINNEVTIDFNGAKKALVYIDGERTEVKLKDNKFTYNLDSGEGVFIIPYN